MTFDEAVVAQQTQQRQSNDPHYQIPLQCACGEWFLSEPTLAVKCATCTKKAG